MKVNEGMRLKENSEKLEWLQTHVDLQGTINFLTAEYVLKPFHVKKCRKLKMEF